jgi:hypothetical protein
MYHLDDEPAGMDANVDRPCGYIYALAFTLTYKQSDNSGVFGYSDYTSYVEAV